MKTRYIVIVVLSVLVLLVMLIFPPRDPLDPRKNYRRRDYGTLASRMGVVVVAAVVAAIAVTLRKKKPTEKDKNLDQDIGIR